MTPKTEPIHIRFLNRLLKSSGKQYRADSDLPVAFVLRFLCGKGVELIRGFLRLRKKVFLGSGVKIEHKKGINFGNSVLIGRGAKISGLAKNGVTLGNGLSLGEYCEISCTSHLSRIGQGISIGQGTGVGAYGFFGASGGITIGENVIMGQYVTFHAQEHNFEERGHLIKDQGVTEKGITVGDNCWIGAKATILDGTTIGRHSVIAAGSVVKGTFPDYAVIAGIPAKVIRIIGEE